MLWKWSDHLTANSLGKTGRQATQAVGAVGERKALVWLTSSTAVEKKKHYWYFNNCLRYSNCWSFGIRFSIRAPGFCIKDHFGRSHLIFLEAFLKFFWFFVGHTFFCHANATYLCFFWLPGSNKKRPRPPGKRDKVQPTPGFELERWKFWEEMGEEWNLSAYLSTYFKNPPTTFG